MNKCVKALLICMFAIISSCDSGRDDETGNANSSVFQCDEDNGSLTLPDGFCAAVVADNLGIVRHIAVHENGTIYVSQRHRNLNVGGLLVLSDSDGDGRMDDVQRYSDKPGMGIQLHGEHLYFASDQQLFRFRLSENDAMPIEPAEIIIKQFPFQEQHSGKPFTIDEQGRIYVNIGAKSNACQLEDRRAGSIGHDPCPELERHAGIWRFEGNQLLQEFSEAERYASGVRNAYAIDWHPELSSLFITQHGRDQLHELWPDSYTKKEGEQLPAEEFMLIEEDKFYGWPYCFYDQLAGKRQRAPEYSHNDEYLKTCNEIPRPIVAFAGHYGPNDLIFYQGSLFPDEYSGGAFIAFHGSYYEQNSSRKGYQVVFIPRQGKTFSTNWRVFADHFAGDASISSPQDAEYRPTGLAIGNDGSLYIADSVQGRIWRVIYQDPS